MDHDEKTVKSSSGRHCHVCGGVQFEKDSKHAT